MRRSSFITETRVEVSMQTIHESEPTGRVLLAIDGEVFAFTKQDAEQLRQLLHDAVRGMADTK